MACFRRGFVENDTWSDRRSLETLNEYVESIGKPCIKVLGKPCIVFCMKTRQKDRKLGFKRSEYSENSTLKGQLSRRMIRLKIRCHKMITMKILTSIRSLRMWESSNFRKILFVKIPKGSSKICPIKGLDQTI